MLALNGMASEVEVFWFFLAEKLGKTVHELQQMPHAEFVGWQAYYESKNASANMTEGGHGGG